MITSGSPPDLELGALTKWLASRMLIWVSAGFSTKPLFHTLQARLYKQDLKVHKHEIFLNTFLQKPKPYGPKGGAVTRDFLKSYSNWQRYSTFKHFRACVPLSTNLSPINDISRPLTLLQSRDSMHFRFGLLDYDHQKNRRIRPFYPFHFWENIASDSYKSEIYSRYRKLCENKHSSRKLKYI